MFEEIVGQLYEARQQQTTKPGKMFFFALTTLVEEFGCGDEETQRDIALQACKALATAIPESQGLMLQYAKKNNGENVEFEGEMSERVERMLGRCL